MEYLLHTYLFYFSSLYLVLTVLSLLKKIIVRLSPVHLFSYSCEAVNARTVVCLCVCVCKRLLLSLIHI